MCAAGTVVVLYPGSLTQEVACLTSCHYRPQRSCGQGNIFSHLNVIQSVHMKTGGLPQGKLKYHPPRSRPP